MFTPAASPAASLTPSSASCESRAVDGCSEPQEQHRERAPAHILPAQGRAGPTLAELRVLALGMRMTGLAASALRGSRPARAGGLSAAQRSARLAAQLRLWASGCRKAIDEPLLRDIVARHPAQAMALFTRFRNAARSRSARR